MVFKGLIQFDDHGRLYILHECEMCMKFPMEDINEPCLACGCSKIALIQLEGKADRANKAIDLLASSMVEEDGEVVEVREAFVQIHAVQLGGGELDMLVLADIEQTDELRKMADLTDHMVRVIIYPTNIRNSELNDDNEDSSEYESFI